MTTILKINYQDLGAILIKPIDGNDKREEFVEGVEKTSTMGRIKEQLAQSFTDLPVEAVDKFAKMIVSFSTQLTQQFVGSFTKEQNPKVSVEFSFGITTELNLQLASASGEGAIKVSVSIDL